MTPPIKFCLVCLSQEAVAEFADSFIEHFLWEGRYLACTKFASDTPFFEVTTIHNEEQKDRSPQEFLIPSHYVVLVSVGQDETVWGYAKSSRPQSS